MLSDRPADVSLRVCLHELVIALEGFFELVIVLEGFFLVNFPCVSSWSPAVPPLVVSESSHRGVPWTGSLPVLMQGPPAVTTLAVHAVSLRQGASLLVKA